MLTTTRTVPSRGLPALRALRAELRAPVANRCDSHLLNCADRAGIRLVCLREGPRGHWDAIAPTVTRRASTVVTDSGVGTRMVWAHGQSMASDRSARAVLRRLLRNAGPEIEAAALFGA